MSSHFVNCPFGVESGYYCDLDDASATPCDACRKYLHSQNFKRSSLEKAAPKTAEQIREEYFAQLREELRNK